MQLAEAAAERSWMAADILQPAGMTSRARETGHKRWERAGDGSSSARGNGERLKRPTGRADSGHRDDV